MFKNAFYAILVATLFVGTATAQSGNKGSSSREAGSATKGSASREAKQQNRMLTRETLKLTGLIQRNDFAGITLTQAQRANLKELVAANYSDLKAATMEMHTLIPEANAKAFQRTYLSAQEEGSSRMEAMKEGMMAIALPEMVQEKMVMANEPREVVMQRIISTITASLNDEQRQTLAQLAAEKEAAMATEKAAMMAKEEAMSKEAGE